MSAKMNNFWVKIQQGIKQIDRRTKISGAQWKIENVPQVIAPSCAYLNGLIFAR